MLSVGEIFKKTREGKGLTLKQIEQEIKIRERFLQAIEEDNWQIFSSKIYIEGIIKNYSHLLKLDSKKMKAFFRREYERNEEVKFKRKVASHYLTPETRKLISFGLSLIFVFFIVYFAYQLKLYLSPPKITLLQPKTAIVKRVDRVKIIGKTEKEATVNIFGERIYQDKDGVFEYNFPLKPGKNELTIEVIGANGKKSSLKKEFTLVSN